MTAATKAPPKLATPLLWVWLTEDADPVEVRTLNADLVASERVARKHKWGTMAESPMTYLTFLAWSAMKRAGKIGADITYEAFEATTAGIADASEDASDADDDAEEDPPGTPTRPDQGSG